MIILGISLIIISMFFAFAPILAAPVFGSFSIFQGMTLAPGSGYEQILTPLLGLGLGGLVMLTYGCVK